LRIPLRQKIGQLAGARRQAVAGVLTARILGGLFLHQIHGFPIYRYGFFGPSETDPAILPQSARLPQQDAIQIECAVDRVGENGTLGDLPRFAKRFEGFLQAGRVQDLGDAEIQQLRFALRGDEDVGRLEVAVNDQIAMGVSDRIANLRCGPYRLTRLLGRGGAGEVFLAERADGQIEQRVAIKLLQPLRRGLARFQDGFRRQSDQIGEWRIRRIEPEERFQLLPQFRRHPMPLEVALALARSEVGHLAE